jgi:hypothetical protein
MLMDNLEKFIRENRESFNDREPSTDLWHKIDRDLDGIEGKQLSIGNYIWKAAAMILFAVVVGLLVEREFIGNSEMAMIEMPGSEEPNITFNEVEDYYFQVINQKQAMISRIIEETPIVDKGLLKEIDQLDSTYQVLKNNLTDVNDDRILDAMVINLQMRIDILNRQLNVLERLQNLNNDETKNI